MFFTIQFPFADLRPFLREQIESIPISVKDGEGIDIIAGENKFVRSFGKREIRGFTPDFNVDKSKQPPPCAEPIFCYKHILSKFWSEERSYYSAMQGLKFPNLGKQTIANGRLFYPSLKRRALHFSQFNVDDNSFTKNIRLEVGINYTLKGTALNQKEFHDAIKGFLTLKSSVPRQKIQKHLSAKFENNIGIATKHSQPEKKYIFANLIDQTTNLAPLIVTALTSHVEKRFTSDIIKAGAPLLTIHFKESEIPKKELPTNIVCATKRIGYMPFSFRIKGELKFISVWLFIMPRNNEKPKKAGEQREIIRNCTIATMRYWAEIRSISIIVDIVKNKNFGFNIQSGSPLCQYLKESITFLSKEQWHGTQLAIIEATINAYEKANDYISIDAIREKLKNLYHSMITQQQTKNNPTKNIFISYSHYDKEWKTKISNILTKHIENLNIIYFDDTMIKPGSSWEAEIEKKLNAADIAILLLSDFFFESNYIKKKELEIIVKQYNKQKLCRILPIWLSGKTPKNHFLSHLQFIQADNGPLQEADELEVNNVMNKLLNNIKAVSLF